MSRWFRHYAGMVRDDKLVRASIKSKQSIERVVWIWSAILESAAEIDDGGRYEIDHAEMARFLRCPPGKLADIEHALQDLGRVHEGAVAKWGNRQFQSDKSAARTKRYRDARKGSRDDNQGTSRDVDVTSQARHGDAPETETETETDTSVAKATAQVDPEKIAFDAGIAFLAQSGVPERRARPLIGKWKRDHGAGAVIAAIGAAQRGAIIDPVPWIENRFRAVTTSARAGEFALP